MDASALYSVSLYDLEMVLYFLERHEIRESPRKMHKLIVNLQVSTQVAQSEPEKVVSWCGFEISKDSHGSLLMC